jgi:hypothetical protein
MRGNTALKSWKSNLLQRHITNGIVQGAMAYTEPLPVAQIAMTLNPDWEHLSMSVILALIAQHVMIMGV